MTTSPRHSFSVWPVVLLLALSWVLLTDAARIRHVLHTSALAEEPPAIDSGSPTGFAGETRRLIVPEHNRDTYHWIIQTQQMIADHAWHLRKIDYENAPFGREVHAASPYRWWLACVAKIDRLISGAPIGLAVERAVLWTDPALHVLFLVGVVIWSARVFGAAAASVAALSLAVLFPFAAEFLPGLTDDRSLAFAAAMLSVILLVRGAAKQYGNKSTDSQHKPDSCFALSGVWGGFALWVSPAIQLPLVVGATLGAIASAWMIRRSSSTAPKQADAGLPWRIWSLAGATTVLVAYLIEFAPDQLGAWQFRSVHPIFGVAWIGLGELAAIISAGLERRRVGGNGILLLRALLAVLAIAALPLALWKTHSLGALEVDVSSLRLARTFGGAAAANTWAWFTRDGLSGGVLATCLPLAVLVPGIWILVRQRGSLATRSGIALVLGPLAVALGFAARQLSWWNGVDAMLLIVAILVAAEWSTVWRGDGFRWAGIFSSAVIVSLGAAQMFPRFGDSTANGFNEAEVFGLVERDLSRWLAKHAGPGRAVVLAPSNLSSTLAYYGSIRGLGAMSWENQEGIGAAVRIASASTPEEAKELIDRRGITHIVIPSWDGHLDVYAQMGMGQLEGTFMSRLHNWKLPPWLKPVPYQLPTIAGFENQSLLILEVVEDQDDAVSLSRVAEYFIETGRVDLATSVSQALRRFPADIGALVARAQVELARSDTTAFEALVEQLKSRLRGSADRTLPWDRRVGLGVVFARAKQVDLAKKQIQRCIEEVDESHVRSLSTGALYRLLVLAKAYEVRFADAKLRELALDLLPADMRARL